MTDTAPPQWLLTTDSRLVIIDVQDRLLAAIDGADAVVENCLKLVRTAQRLGVPVAATEQNPAGIGPTTAPLAALIPLRFGKVHFSAARQGDFLAWAAGGGTVLLAGTEAHVCVLQTALGLKALGLRVGVVMDAAGSRQPASRQAAFDRLRAHGVELVTVEMVLFEWLERYDRPEFREVLRLIK
ncbi:isochorismatase family protein [Niveispirillum sp. KHB5.9]|uniref:isochorismatase family protein n=1 Tax=Niveispirillum sp. KHB5.9 TaxID=3400269 RepID=UPI003A8B8D34